MANRTKTKTGSLNQLQNQIKVSYYITDFTHASIQISTHTATWSTRDAGSRIPDVSTNSDTHTYSEPF